MNIENDWTSLLPFDIDLLSDLVGMLIWLHVSFGYV